MHNLAHRYKRETAHYQI